MVCRKNAICVDSSTGCKKCRLVRCEGVSDISQPYISSPICNLRKEISRRKAGNKPNCFLVKKLPQIINGEIGFRGHPLFYWFVFTWDIRQRKRENNVWESTGVRHPDRQAVQLTLDASCWYAVAFFVIGMKASSEIPIVSQGEQLHWSYVKHIIINPMHNSVTMF